ncbi:hypothetical protein EBT31_19850 [bacterium]|nr:hypothetical protein [bacterium]
MLTNTANVGITTNAVVWVTSRAGILEERRGPDEWADVPTTEPFVCAAARCGRFAVKGRRGSTLVTEIIFLSTEIQPRAFRWVGGGVTALVGAVDAVWNTACTVRGHIRKYGEAEGRCIITSRLTDRAEEQEILQRDWAVYKAELERWERAAGWVPLLSEERHALIRGEK